jgi:hypothetical protein
MARSGRVRLWMFLIVCSLSAAGCGKEHRTIKFKGTVTLDGKPLDGAVVSFFPLADDGRSAAGVSGTDGVFRVTTFTPGDGALPGEYRVTVVMDPPPEVDGGAVAGESSMDFMMRAKPNFSKMGQKIEQSKKEAKKRPPLLPPQYAHPTKSPLKCKIPFQGELSIDLNNKGGT